MLREDDRQRFETPPPGRMLEYVKVLTDHTPPPASSDWDEAHVAAKLNEIFDTCTVVEVTLIKSVILLVLNDLRSQLAEQVMGNLGVDTLVVVTPEDIPDEVTDEPDE